MYAKIKRNHETKLGGIRSVLFGRFGYMLSGAHVEAAWAVPS